MPTVEKKEQFHWGGLPLISVLPKEQMKEAQLLLEELEAVQLRRKIEQEREQEIKETLGKLQASAELPGLRFGKLCFAETMMPGRKTLDKEALILKGCKVEWIAECTKTGKPFVEREFRVID